MEFWNAVIGFLWDRGPELVMRLGVAVLIFAAVAVTGRLLAGVASRSLNKRRADSLGPLLRRLIAWVAYIAAAMMSLDHLGVDVATLLAGAGIIGLAVGFGAQNLVKDVITGFFLMLDDELREGDFVAVGDAVGTVEHVGLRVTRLRAFDGTLWYLSNGDISRVANKSREWMLAIVGVGLAYEEEVARGLKVIQEVGDKWAEEHGDIILDSPLAQGVVGLNASDVGVRLIVKLRSGEQWAAERELRHRIKKAFDEQGVEIPFPRQVTYHRQEQGTQLAVSSGKKV